MDFFFQAAAEDVARHRATGQWRTRTVLDDVRRWAAETPDAPAVLADGGDDAATVVTYRELAERTDRYAGALAELGVGPGDVVSVQLPNVWRVVVLALATWQRGGIWASVMPTLGERELALVLARLQPRVFLRTVGDAALVLRGAAGEDDVDVTEFFDSMDRPPTGDRPVGSDVVSTVLFTSGTTGEPKGVLRTLNNIYATELPQLAEPGGRDPLRTFSSQSLMHAAASNMLVRTLVRGGSILVSDRWDSSRTATLLERHAVDQISIAPGYLSELLEACRSRPSARSALRRIRDVFVLGSAIPAPLVATAVDEFGLRVRCIWGMTEGGRIATPVGAPPHAAAHSLGEAAVGTEIMLHPTGPDGRIHEHAPGELRMRGAAVCLATVGRDSGRMRLVADDHDGWYDTGDLAVPDGDGGFRLVGRQADRVGGAFMIPIKDVEEALLGHPAIRDVAVVGYRDGAEGCAVVVADEPVKLAGLHDYLGRIGMTRWYWPTRVEQVDELPRNGMGKVDTAGLRARVGSGG